MTIRKKTIAVSLGVAFLAGHAMAAQGPSSSATPYMVPAQPGIEFTSILTVGDTVKKKHKGDESYRMVGIPDGLGAYDNGDGTITVLMNHELGAAAGVPRAHGGTGAFVSKWQVRKSDLKVLNGEDLITKVYLWNGSEYVDTPNALFSLFCSADLPKKTAFFNADTGLGFNDGYIFMNGEEAGPTGRAFAHVVQGRRNSATYELPLLGKFSWENAVASPYAQAKTIVAGLDDGSIGTSKLYFYVGTKQAEGKPIDQAGLTNGINYQVLIASIGADEGGIPQGDTSPRGFSLATSGGTGFNRVEDGAWDTQNPNVFYFVTTASFTTNSRLWKVTFHDVRTPEAGGTIQVVVDGGTPAVPGAGPRMMDNITVDSGGSVLAQEDPGNQTYIARIWSVNPASRVATAIASFDPARFTPGTAGFITQGEESSGVVEVTELFAGVDGYDTASYRYFLLDAQVHASAGDPELVEKGQLLMMRALR